MTRRAALAIHSSLVSTSYQRKLENQRLRRHIAILLQLKVRPGDNDPKLMTKVTRIARIHTPTK